MTVIAPIKFIAPANAQVIVIPSTVVVADKKDAACLPSADYR